MVQASIKLETPTEIGLQRQLVVCVLEEALWQMIPGNIDPALGLDFRENTKRYQTALIETALDLAQGNRKRAAKLLNLPLKSLYQKIKQLNIRHSMGPWVAENSSASRSLVRPVAKNESDQENKVKDEESFVAAQATRPRPELPESSSVRNKRVRHEQNTLSP